jgi:Ig domain of plant-specific actin-binding protein
VKEDSMKRLLILIGVVAAFAGVSAAAAFAAGGAPVNTSAPTISGLPYVGKTQTASPGTWTNSPTSFTYQWARCDAHGNNCNQISGATMKTYVPTSADVNHTLEVWVTASNSAGTTGPVNSKPTAVITPALPPKNTVPPSVIGKPLVGAKLFANPGSYSGGSVQTFTYQWQSCDPNSLICTDLSGATSQTYTVAKSDVGKRLRVKVTATNPFGSVTTASAATTAVTVPVVVVKTTMAASMPTTICCQRVLLTGTTSPAKAGEQITIIAHEAGSIASYPAGTTTTDTSGSWSLRVTPMVNTEYTAQTSTSTTGPLTILVHPRVGFGVNGNTFSAKITGRDSFAGRIALFQNRTASGRWHTLAFIVINRFSVAKFVVKLRHGHTYTLRIFLPQAQAGPDYLYGVSHVRRVGGAF